MAFTMHWNPFARRADDADRDIYQLLVGELSEDSYQVGILDYLTLGLPRGLTVVGDVIKNAAEFHSGKRGLTYGVAVLLSLPLKLPELILKAAAVVLTPIVFVLAAATLMLSSVCQLVAGLFKKRSPAVYTLSDLKQANEGTLPPAQAALIQQAFDNLSSEASDTAPRSAAIDSDIGSESSFHTVESSSTVVTFGRNAQQESQPASSERNEDTLSADESIAPDVGQIAFV